MSDQPTEARQASGLTVERSPNFHTIVADLFKMRISPGDCTIICGRSSGVGVIEEQAEILMSWGHLKILAMNLMEMVAAIEKEAGPIPIPRFFYDSGNMRFAANLAT